MSAEANQVVSNQESMISNQSKNLANQERIEKNE
jgi:hypothetical protein